MQIFIRHGNDNKSSKYQHDNSLNLCKKYVTDDIIKLTKKLIKKYGYPVKIYCSPFNRVIQTVNIMEPILKNNTEIIIEPKLSRFFNKKEQLHPSVRKETLKYYPPIYENNKEFKKRVDKIDNKLHKKNYTVWYISHYLVLKRIANNNNITIPDKMPFLFTMIV